ncbi:ABC transporter permease [Sediminicoccus rosea]|jgi:peptide/nickel transport system permease protein|uniref:ABC transporter permease n=1 Tax=Sediminicoccus rosea TaxID=1225128 RepID=A0ABZ0PD88_9PROT|nr:ABC transporter permease [Sediminicoccus rosea]WPB83486.1 ABC transporter permease [Sediminicoccus rosea]
MLGFLARRFVSVVFVLWAMTVMVFAIVHILPGSVAHMILGEFATNAAIAELEERLGLNLPLYEQYWRWFSGLLRGDFGQSLTMDRPAGPVILEALGRSAILCAISIVLVAIIGIALGIHSATHVGSWADRGLTLAQYFFIAVPEFFWCILVIIFFAVWLGWLPATGYTPLAEGGFLAWAKHLILPVSTLVLGLIAHVSRLTRSSMLEAIESKYVLAARAKGLPERIVLRRHALPNALLPTITVLAVDVGILIGGIVVVESVFAFPGLGRMLIYAIDNQDIPLMMGGMIVITAIYALANLVADILYAVLNPRIRVSGSAG